MATLLITGVSGYVGARLVARALADGHRVVTLGTTWRLCEELPPGAFENVDAVVHLAHSWKIDAERGHDDVNVLGTELLAKAAKSCGVKRFVYVSSVSSRPNARNVYGRTKFRAEERLRVFGTSKMTVISAQVGLVYGGEKRGQYGLLSRLVRQPILPMIGLNSEVQPIHLDEVCHGLIALACDPGLVENIYVLAAPAPITFRTWLWWLSLAEVGRSPFFLSMPSGAVLLACRLLMNIPLVPKSLIERMLGLINTKFVASEESIDALGLVIKNPVDLLGVSRLVRRHVLGVSITLLHYVLGRKPPIGAVIRLARRMQCKQEGALKFNHLLMRFPSFLRLFDPVYPVPGHSFAQHLQLAVWVGEALPQREGASVSRGRFFLIGQVLIEIIFLPARILFGRMYA